MTQHDEIKAEVADLRSRVERLENLASARLADAAAAKAASEEDQLFRDKAVMSRYPNSRAEAIAQEDARRRLADRGLIDAHGRLKVENQQDAAEALPSTPASPSAVNSPGAGPDNLITGDPDDDADKGAAGKTTAAKATSKSTTSKTAGK